MEDKVNLFNAMCAHQERQHELARLTRANDCWQAIESHLREVIFWGRGNSCLFDPHIEDLVLNDFYLDASMPWLAYKKERIIQFKVILNYREHQESAIPATTRAKYINVPAELVDNFTNFGFAAWLASEKVKLEAAEKAKDMEILKGLIERHKAQIFAMIQDIGIPDRVKK